MDDPILTMLDPSAGIFSKELQDHRGELVRRSS